MPVAVWLPVLPAACRCVHSAAASAGLWTFAPAQRLGHRKGWLRPPSRLLRFLRVSSYAQPSACSGLTALGRMSLVLGSTLTTSLFGSPSGRTSSEPVRGTRTLSCPFSAGMPRSGACLAATRSLSTRLPRIPSARTGRLRSVGWSLRSTRRAPTARLTAARTRLRGTARPPPWRPGCVQTVHEAAGCARQTPRRASHSTAAS